MYLFNIHTSTHVYVLCVCMQGTQVREGKEEERVKEGREAEREKRVGGERGGKGKRWRGREGHVPH